MGESSISGRLIIIIVLGLVLIIASSLLYFLLLGGMKDEIKQVEHNIQQEQQLLAALQERVEREQEELSRSTLALQRNLPVQPLVDQFLLDIEQAELVSDSLISSFNISQGQNTLSVTAPNEGGSEEQADENGTEEMTENVSISRPDGIKRVTVSMSVRSDSYEQLLQLLDSIEGLTRVTKIDSLAFPGPHESSFDPDAQAINYSLTVSTFYADELYQLLDDLPWVEYPDPAEKSNPLFN